MDARVMWRRTLALATILVVLVVAFIGQFGAPTLSSTSVAQRTSVSQAAVKPLPDSVCGVPVPC
jgi:hypothetical protein